jgi:queuine tRNA-ribosyltransferase
MKFQILHADKDTRARSGKISTDHGIIETPVFMPVGTAGSVKAVHQKELVEDVKADIILGNTYHLFLRPGIDIIRQAGGLHRFMNWDRPLLTDSGGYQVFSLSENRKLTEEGVIFSSHIDGSKHMFTPESVVDIQRQIGADIMMALDECAPYPCEYKYARASIELTHKWLERGLKRLQETSPQYTHHQYFIPIVQGSVYEDLRKQSAETVASYDFEANAIGGLSVGEPVEKMYQMVEVVSNILPLDRPRYLMGVGMPENILEAVSLGIDMFDCVIPTRNARNGMLFTRDGIINIRNNKWKDDFSAIERDGASFVDTQYSKAYLRHLVSSGEILGAQIATLHNLCFYMWLLRECREKIKEGIFGTWMRQMMKRLSQRL